MGTRAQVRIISKRKPEPQRAITIYRHCDGGPEIVIPLIKAAYDRTPVMDKAGFAGKVAAYLCAEDPGQFEPEERKDPYPDITPNSEYSWLLGNS